jgi:saccharopine dehydrogenase (NADP+, L-glutamate forming)
MPTVHWVGTGLSSISGLSRLIATGHDVIVWNRTVAKAEVALGDIKIDIRAFDLNTLAEALEPGDVAISMLPGEWHVPIAKACLASDAHFVSSSYIAPEMRELDEAFKAKGLSCVNEVGLDPGIDHLMAHTLVADYKASTAYDPANAITFRSYCGGVPKVANPFRYKFSWSPLGVLKALRSPSKSIKDFEEFNVSRPWHNLTSYEAPLPIAESFEVYPNRDSLPFLEDYQFGTDWKIDTFVRGTMRLNGWAKAWGPLFEEIETLSGPEGDARLVEISDDLWDQHQFEKGEADRVVMCVELRAVHNDAPVYHKTYVMDAWGDERGNAMARLVSIPVSLAVEAVLSKSVKSGVSPAPSDPKLVSKWLDEISKLAQHLDIVDHMRGSDPS